MPQSCWCGNHSLEPYSEFYDKCTSCGTLVSKIHFTDSIYHVQDENQDTYGKHYWQKEMLEMSGVNSMDELIDLYLKGRCAYWCRYIVKYIRPRSTIAEVGCGLGQFSYMLQSIGYRTTGVELSADICHFVQNTLHIKMHHGELKDLFHHYDAILGFDLLEHIAEPIRFLINCRRKVGKKGILCFQTPCYDESLSYSDMLQEKPRFVEQLKKEQHIYIYSKRSVQTLLRKCGFEYITFEPAYFGEDYDMFLFASTLPFTGCKEEEWNMRIHQMPNGRIIKSLIQTEENIRSLNLHLQNVQKDSEKRLANANLLAQQLRETQEDSAQRLRNSQILTEQLLETQKDSAQRLKNNQILEQLLAEKDQLIQELTRNNTNEKDN